MTYLYHCTECNITFEVDCPPFEPVLKAQCPECAGECNRSYHAIHHTWSNGCWDWDNDGLGNNLVKRHRA